MSISKHVSPDRDELYQRLLPIYQANCCSNKGLYYTFSKYYVAGKSDYSAGEALQKALREKGLIPLEDISSEDISSMEDGAEEYEEIMSLQSLMERETL